MDDDLILFAEAPEMDQRTGCCPWQGCVHSPVNLIPEVAVRLLSADSSPAKDKTEQKALLLSDVKADNTTSSAGIQIAPAVVPKKVEKSVVAAVKSNATVCASHASLKHWLWKCVKEGDLRCHSCKKTQKDFIFECPRCMFKMCFHCRAQRGWTSRGAKDMRRQLKNAQKKPRDADH
ncbi:hypothetical protein BDP55DRAFT_721989 [Colletotrichum godetiae]|uniref:IBR domain-containing protein n=1 Tax=Colletotrichum godetiae TaxID=1209918 RepID=A0AAJ0A548_9PEZI|nr:uncharacterized protein BDP55DRAFT_721988 [Colletotrichum godetiae]XP_060421440.1 uncharacterized protein BDP55DRAFT_721989 [Colletotrichum godetiae]KAK1656673.1 hypothetical protein BDP55DRAFT_721988 [Colletotrichum godetiae]KAK1656676.1 hypothetical protein BDP55DRAFT_721989 [Colletotrichum godetiae]